MYFCFPILYLFDYQKALSNDEISNNNLEALKKELDIKTDAALNNYLLKLMAEEDEDE
jgi:hypothetical protein